VLEKVLRDLQFPRHMRWDAMIETRGRVHIRPARSLAPLLYWRPRRALHDRAIAAGLESPRPGRPTGAVTYGHRFLATSGRAGRAIKVRSFDEYRKKLAENSSSSRATSRDRIMRDLEAQARRLGGRAMLAPASAGAGAPRGSPGPCRVSGGRERARFGGVPVSAAEVLTTTLITISTSFPSSRQNGAFDAGVSCRHQILSRPTIGRSP